MINPITLYHLEKQQLQYDLSAHSGFHEVRKFKLNIVFPLDKLEHMYYYRLISNKDIL
jgi:hypothetical protein